MNKYLLYCEYDLDVNKKYINYFLYTPKFTYYFNLPMIIEKKPFYDFFKEILLDMISYKNHFYGYLDADKYKKLIVIFSMNGICIEEESVDSSLSQEEYKVRSNISIFLEEVIDFSNFNIKKTLLYRIKNNYNYSAYDILEKIYDSKIKIKYEISKNFIAISVNDKELLLLKNNDIRFNIKYLLHLKSQFE